MEIKEYKGFEIRRHRKSYRIYIGDLFLDTSASMKKAKQRIDFCLEKGIWK